LSGRRRTCSETCGRGRRVHVAIGRSLILAHLEKDLSADLDTKDAIYSDLVRGARKAGQQVQRDARKRRMPAIGLALRAT